MRIEKRKNNSKQVSKQTNSRTYMYTTKTRKSIYSLLPFYFEQTFEISWNLGVIFFKAFTMNFQKLSIVITKDGHLNHFLLCIFTRGCVCLPHYVMNKSEPIFKIDR